MQLKFNKPAQCGGFFLCLGALFAPALLIFLVVLIFTPALPGVIHFDDRANLQGLAGIHDLTSALQWIGEGIAGPLGRPLSLASFALQHADWPNPEPLLAWNIALHAINALLAFWLSLILGRRMGWSEGRALCIAWLAAALWAALPLLNSSVLFIVQRMTVLSATFTLTGLLLYLKLRGDAQSSQVRQLAALAAMGLAGILTMLAKENGVMIVLYALVLEVALLHRAGQRRPSLALGLLATANFVLLILLLRYAQWSTCAELQRGFGMWERLGSQGFILFAYIKSLFLPQLAELNPFRFHHFGDHGALLLWGLPLWFALMLAPVLLWWRGWRLAALTAAWFFWGHLMESGWLSLEPYFAHRNYLPALLPIFALVAWGASAKHHAKLKNLGLTIYLALLATVTWMNTSLWGNRFLASEIWALEEPRSTRAALNTAYALEEQFGLAQAQDYLDRFMLNQRDSTGLRMQRLISACALASDINQSELVQDVIHAIPRLPYEGWATDLVEDLDARLEKGQCLGVPKRVIAEIAGTFLADKRYACSPSTAHNMLMLIGLAAWREGDAPAAVDFWLQALEHSVSYATAVMVLENARALPDTQALKRLLQAIEHAPTPRSTTDKEWQDLIAETREAANQASP